MTYPWWLVHRKNSPFQHPSSTTPTITSPTARTPILNDFVDHYGLTFFWSPLHRTSQQLNVLRALGDKYADPALLDMRLGPLGDPLECFQTAGAAGTAGTAGTGEAEGPIARLYNQLTTVPSWVDWDQIRRGQNVFIRYAGGTGMSLLNCSLVGGFGAPKINKVLGATGYLSRSCAGSYVRLFETLQMIADCMEPDGLLPTTGVGWKASIRVRMLHAKIRKRLRGMDKWQEKEWGCPINQEDMAATLLSFQIIVLECLNYMGFALTVQEQEDYTHVWRLIGYYSGCDEEYNACTSLAYSRATLESITFHIVHPDATSAQMSNHMLRAVANRPPLHMSYACGAQLSRMLLGEVGADKLQLPPEHAGWHVYHAWHFLVLRFFVQLSWLPWVGGWMLQVQRQILQGAAKKFQGGVRTRYHLKHVPDDQHFDAMQVGTMADEKKGGNRLCGSVCFNFGGRGGMCGKWWGRKATRRWVVVVVLVAVVWQFWRSMFGAQRFSFET